MNEEDISVADVSEAVIAGSVPLETYKLADVGYMALTWARGRDGSLIHVGELDLPNGNHVRLVLSRAEHEKLEVLEPGDRMRKLVMVRAEAEKREARISATAERDNAAKRRKRKASKQSRRKNRAKK